MQKKLFLTTAIVVAVIFVRLATADPLQANDSLAVALTGQVSSKKMASWKEWWSVPRSKTRPLRLTL